MTIGLARMADVARLCWQTGRMRCGFVLATVVVSIVGQPLLGLLLRDFTNAVIARNDSAAVHDATLAALLWGVANQAQGLRNLLLNDIRALTGLRIDEDVVLLTAQIPGIGHLEDPRTLDRISSVKGATAADSVAAAIETAGSVLGIAATMLALSTVSPYLPAMLPLALPVLWFNRVGQARLRRALDRAAEAQRTADQLLETLFDPVTATEMRVTGAGPVLLDAYQARWARATRIRVRARAEFSALLAVGYLISAAGIGLALAFVVWRMSTGHAGVGDVVLLLTVARQQQGLVQATVAGLTRVVEGAHAVRSYEWLRQLAAESGSARPAEAVAVPEQWNAGVSVEGVSFTYPGTDRTVLHDITVTLKPGSVVALVGGHGSGKTSLIKLITGMYEPSAGRISVDGRPLTEYDPAAWRDRIACGFQDYVRFQTVAREAVGLGDLPRIDDLARVQAAVERGGAQAVVERLDHGLQTQLGTSFGGVGLSGGQWQRLALARACMRESPLLVVLDEPTAALDPRGEYEVYQRQIAMARTLAERSRTVTLIVSHRFSTVRSADHILVLANGRIVEAGDHDSLIALGGQYARLYGLQRDAYRSTPA